jgi:hypothetical protein
MRNAIDLENSQSSHPITFTKNALVYILNAMKIPEIIGETIATTNIAGPRLSTFSPTAIVYLAPSPRTFSPRLAFCLAQMIQASSKIECLDSAKGNRR